MKKRKHHTLEQLKRAQLKLLPCPFCGCSRQQENIPWAADILLQEYGYMVVCWDRCGCHMRVHSYLIRSVIVAWNYRPGV